MEQVNALNATGRSTNVLLAAQALIVVAMLCGRSWQESTGECHAFIGARHRFRCPRLPAGSP